MRTQRFIVKQHAKLYWKLMTGDDRSDQTDVVEANKREGFWQYEQTPRAL